MSSRRALWASGWVLEPVSVDTEIVGLVKDPKQHVNSSQNGAYFKSYDEYG
ncbi:MAG: hypothetical protein LBE83_09605 [Propionibacteriaceae bacterium]|nr:hypothetical protein [Propionibacteriaceae bacterium]